MNCNLQHFKVQRHPVPNLKWAIETWEVRGSPTESLTSTSNVEPMQTSTVASARGLPQELYDEIIGFLWNDISSLRACSLANRIMTLPSQKRLFYCIALRAPLQKLNDDRRIFDNGLCGTSYNFRQLLLRSPHIAKYVVSLHIVDRWDDYKSNLETLGGSVPGNMEDEIDDGEQYIGYKLANGQDMSLDAPLVPTSESRFHRQWLPADKFLPLCAPFLCNLRSLSVLYDNSWYHLSGRVFITLLNRMRLPSLRYLQINSHQFPRTIINQAIGENIRHLILNGYPQHESRALQLPHPPLAPVYLDSLSIDSRGLLLFSPVGRVQFSRLRKLVVWGSDHMAIWSLLQSCSGTLLDFEISPDHCKACQGSAHSINLFCFLVILQRIRANTSHEDIPDEPINLGKLAALRRFAVSLWFLSYADSNSIWTPFPWLNKILRSGYSAPSGQQLEDISIRIHFSFGYQTLARLDILHWKDTFEMFLEDEFKSLLNLRIFVSTQARIGNKVVEMLENSVYVKRLRARRNLVVDIRGKDSILLSIILSFLKAFFANSRLP